MFFVVLCTHLVSMYSMDTSLAHSIYLPLEDNYYVIPLAATIAHITGYQPVVNKEGKHKLLGFHHYQPTQIKQLPEGGTLSKLSSNLWVVTFGDPTTFHTGYVIYKGRIYAEPKTFFPCSWNKQQISEYIKDYMTSYFSNDNVLRPCKIEPASSNVQYSMYHFNLDALKSDQCSLKLIVKNYAHLRNGSFIVTLYPVVQKLLLTMAQKEIVRTTALRQLLKLKEHVPNSTQAIPNVTVPLAQTALMTAARKGDWQLISLLLEENNESYNIHTLDSSDTSVLFYALDSDDIYTVQSVIHAQEINLKNKAGVTPLIHAITTGKSIDIIDYLLSWGADPNLADGFGLNPLMHIIRSATLEASMSDTSYALTALLLSYGANPNSTNREGDTAVIYALKYLGTKSKPLIKLFLNFYADCSIKNNRNEGALKVAQVLGLTDIPLLLQEHEDKKASWLSEHKGNELMYAIFVGDMRKVQQLLTENQIPVNAHDTLGQTPLYFALQNGNLELVKLLLDAGADPRVIVHTTSIYEYAQRHTQLALEIKQLVKQAYNTLCAPELERKRKQQQDLNQLHKSIVEKFNQEASDGLITPETLQAITIFKDSPLQSAVKKKQHAVVEQLLKHGVKPELRNNILLLALANDDMSMLTVLLSSQAIPTSHIQEMWDNALKDQNYVLIDHISVLIPKFKVKMVLEAIARQDIHVLKILLHPERSEVKYRDLSLCLFAAFETHNNTLIKLLVDRYPALAHAVTVGGQTALMVAAQADMIESIQVLYLAGAQLQTKNDLGLTVLDYKLSRRVQELLLTLADREQQKAQQLEQANKKQLERAQLEAQGWTPLMLTVYYNDTIVGNGNSTNINAASVDGLTALMIAAREKKNQALGMLIEHADINLDQQDSQGNTALMYAIEAANCTGVQQLLKAGVCKDRVNLKGTNAEAIAKSMYSSNPELMRLLAQVYKLKKDVTKPITLDQAFEIIVSGADSGLVRTWLANNISVSNWLLVKACAYGNELVVEKLLAIPGINSNAQDEYNLTPLVAAVVNKHTAIVKRLLLYDNSNIYKQNTKNLNCISSTLLGFALLKGRVTIFKILLDVWPKEITPNHLGDDILNEACRLAPTSPGIFDCLAIIPFGSSLLEGIADRCLEFPIEKNNFMKLMPLLIRLPESSIDKLIEKAVDRDNVDALRILLTLNHTLSPTDLLRLSLSFNKNAVYSYIMEHYTVDFKKKFSDNEVMSNIAYYNNNTPFIDSLCDKMYKNSLDEQAKSICVQEDPAIRGSSSLLRDATLLKIANKHNMLPNECEMNSQEGKEILSIIRSYNYVPAVQLIEKFDEAHDLSLLLIAACQEGHRELVELLVAKPSVDVNCTAANAVTPLEAAIAAGHYEIVKLLLSVPTIQIHKPGIREGSIPFETAIKHNQIDIVELFLQSSYFKPLNESKTRDIMSYCVFKGSLEIIELLVRNNFFDCHDLNNAGPMLKAAVLLNNIPLTILLLTMFDTKTTKDVIGTALCEACYTSNKEIISVLIRSCDSITINYLKEGKHNPLMIAVARGRKDIVELLLSCKEFSIGLNLKNARGENALFIALACGEYEIAQLLVQYGASIGKKENASKKTVKLYAFLQQLPRLDH